TRELPGSSTLRPSALTGARSRNRPLLPDLPLSAPLHITNLYLPMTSDISDWIVPSPTSLESHPLPTRRNGPSTTRPLPARRSQRHARPRPAGRPLLWRPPPSHPRLRKGPHPLSRDPALVGRRPASAVR